MNLGFSESIFFSKPIEYCLYSALRHHLKFFVQGWKNFMSSSMKWCDGAVVVKWSRKPVNPRSTTASIHTGIYRTFLFPGWPNNLIAGKWPSVSQSVTHSVFLSLSYCTVCLSVCPSVPWSVNYTSHLPQIAMKNTPQKNRDGEREGGAYLLL